MMDELREMARAPVAIFDRFLAELQQITRDKSLSAPVGVERLKGLQESMVREIEGSLLRFRNKVGQAEVELTRVLRPSRLTLCEQISRAVQRLQHLVNLAVRREKLLRAWEDQPAEKTVEGYRAALQREGIETAELYEADAERVLRRKGNAAALQTFLALRAQAEESRLTPPQKEARAYLEEIAQLKHEVTMATRVIASTLKVSGSIAVVGAGWRRGIRLRLDPEEQSRTPVLVLPGAHPGMTAQVVDVSRGGVRLAVPDELPSGATLQFIVKAADGREVDIRLQGEVRWCRADPRTTGRFLAGVRLMPASDDQWLAVVTRLARTLEGNRPAPEAGGT